MNGIVFSKPDQAVGETLDRWLDGYIQAPHPAIGHSGAICPFVAPSVKADSLLSLSFRWTGGYVLERMADVIDAAVGRFHGTRWPAANLNLQALVVVFPNLPAEAWWLIDEGHRAAKDGVIAQGLMLGQFHPRCTAPAARNPLFPVNRSPFPLLALRNMALHDILFVHDNPGWFAAYRERFSAKYEGSRPVEPHFAALYAAAAARDLEPASLAAR